MACVDTFLGMGSTAWEALAAIGTLLAVIVSLLQSSRSEKVRIRAILEIAPVIEPTLILRITNVGLRKAYIRKILSKESSSGETFDIEVWKNFIELEHTGCTWIDPGDARIAEIEFIELIKHGYPALSFYGLYRRIRMLVFGPCRMYVESSEGKRFRVKIPNKTKALLLDYMKHGFREYDRRTEGEDED